MNAPAFQSAALSLDTLAYSVKPGDTLGAIVKRYYGTLPPLEQQAMIRQIQADNPRIKNSNLIHPGLLIKLNVPQRYCAAPYGFPHHSPILTADENWFPQLQRNWETSSPEERSMLSALAPWFLGGGAAGFATLDRTFKSNSPIIREIVANYEAYKRGDVSKGKYDYRRKKLVNDLSRNLGPTNYVLNGNRDISEVLRVSRTSGTTPTQPMVEQMNRMNSISKAAARGGVVLSAVGLGMACNEIANTDNNHKKNEILVESVGSLGGGIVTDLAVTATLVIMSTPIGWAGAVVVGIGGAVAGWATGRTAKKLYNRYGQEVDLVTMTGVSELCSGDRSARNVEGKKYISSNTLSVL